MIFKAVLFDLDDTLIVDEVVSRETFANVAKLAAERHGANAASFAVDAARHARDLWAAGPHHALCKALGISAFECLWGDFVSRVDPWPSFQEWSLAFRQQVFDRALRDQLIEDPDGGEELSVEFAHERRRLPRLMPNVRETLVRLSASYALGMLTNGSPDLQREKIAASGLGDFFQAIAVSGEHGIGKPRPEIFQILAEELGVSVGECVMVGNSLERDILGARNAGMRSAWLKVPGSEEHADVEIDLAITGLAELPDLLLKLEQAEATIAASR
ncbi:HAD family hydrolase [soil metagenome]